MSINRFGVEPTIIYRPWHVLVMLQQPATAATFTNLAATISNRQANADVYFQTPPLQGVTQIMFVAKIKTPATVATSYMAPTYSVANDGTGMKFFDGSDSTGGAAAPGTPANVYGIQLNQAAGWYHTAPMPIPAVLNSQTVYPVFAYATFGGDGVDDPVVQGFGFYCR